MLKHSDPEVQALVEMLESQRDQAMAQAAAFSRLVQELQDKVNNQESEEKIGGTD